MLVSIRLATTTDAAAIARVHVETWRSTYRGVVPEAYLAALSPVARAAVWRTLLTAASGARFVLVATDGADAVVGFAAAGPSNTVPSYRSELSAIYILPAFQRLGLGQALVRGAAVRLVAVGMSSMVAWVLEANTRARHFYERLGGAPIGRQAVTLGGARLVEMAYGWAQLSVLLAPKDRDAA
jgi:ribosomal protein S18 acetylase RimI-like enzyme